MPKRSFAVFQSTNDSHTEPRPATPAWYLHTTSTSPSRYYKPLTDLQTAPQRLPSRRSASLPNLEPRAATPTWYPHTSSASTTPLQYQKLPSDLQAAHHCVPLRRRSLPNLETLRQLPLIAALTAANLAAMDPSQPPMTPEHTISSTPRSATTTKTARGDHCFLMGLYGLLDDFAGKDRLKQRPALGDAVRVVIGADRDSAMKPASVKKFTQQLAKTKTRNEGTVAARLMPFLIKDERTQPISPAQEGPGPALMPSRLEQEYEIQRESRRDQGIRSVAEQEERRTALRAFELDHLDYNIDRDFSRDSVPFPPHARKSRADCGIKNPKPDLTYGIDRDAFSAQELQDLESFEPELSKGIVSPFLVVEWKGFNGSATDAKNQTRRSGAAMVHSRRQAVSRLVEPLIGDALDLATMAFTCVMNEQAAHVNIHWAEEKDGEVQWLVAVLKRFFLEDNLLLLRSVLHNIVDWGLSVRKADVKAQLRQYQTQLCADDEGASGPSAKRKRL